MRNTIQAAIMLHDELLTTPQRSRVSFLVLI
jgi:hypothetical protein